MALFSFHYLFRIGISAYPWSVTSRNNAQICIAHFYALILETILGAVKILSVYLSNYIQFA
jgi:hypothetical protein